MAIAKKVKSVLLIIPVFSLNVLIICSLSAKESTSSLSDKISSKVTI